MRRTICLGLTAIALALAPSGQAGAQTTPDATVAPVVCRAEADGRAPATAGSGQARATAQPGFAATGAAPLLADRGIGGTGAPEQTADRGIGGTGIVGAITGFASVCVNGVEVAYGKAENVTIDGAAAAPDALRVGQIAAIEADSTDSGLAARSISVRHEVSGPVEAVLGGGKVLVVARQRVLLRPRTIMGGTAPRVGDWVAVSGFRTPVGAILATRVDPRAPGSVTVSGVLRRRAFAASADLAHINRLDIRLSAGMPPSTAPPHRVTVTGHLAGGVLVADSVNDAQFLQSPGIRRFFVQAYVARARNRLQLGDGFEVDVDKRFGAAPDSADIAIVELESTEAGRLVAVGLRDADNVNHGLGAIQTAPAALATKEKGKGKDGAKDKDADKAAAGTAAAAGKGGAKK